MILCFPSLPAVRLQKGWGTHLGTNSSGQKPSQPVARVRDFCNFVVRPVCKRLTGKVEATQAESCREELLYPACRGGASDV